MFLKTQTYIHARKIWGEKATLNRVLGKVVDWEIQSQQVSLHSLWCHSSFFNKLWPERDPPKFLCWHPVLKALGWRAGVFRIDGVTGVNPWWLRIETYGRILWVPPLLNTEKATRESRPSPDMTVSLALGCSVAATWIHYRRTIVIFIFYDIFQYFLPQIL